MGAWPVYYVWPTPSHFIFESPDNWLNTHKADWRWPIIILLIGRDGQSRGQRSLAGGVLYFTHRIPTSQCILGFVKRNYYCVMAPLCKTAHSPFVSCSLAYSHVVTSRVCGIQWMWLFPVDHTYGNPVYWSNGYSGINPSHNSSLLVSVFIIIITIIIVLESPSGGVPLRHMYVSLTFQWTYRTQSLKRISVETRWLPFQTAYSNTFSWMQIFGF